MSSHHSEYQKQLLSKYATLFAQCCIEEFGYLLNERAYRFSLEMRNQGCVQVMMKQDIQTEYFAVRVFHDFDDMWCEIERFAGLGRRRRVRLPDLAREFGLPIEPAHSEVRMEGDDPIPSRVAEYASFIRENYDVLRNIPFLTQTA